MPPSLARPNAAGPETDLAHSLRWIAQIACGATLLAVAIALGGTLYFIVNPQPALHLLGSVAIPPAVAIGDPGAARIKLFIALLPALGLFVLTANGIFRLFRRFGEGRILDGENARLLRNIGWFLFASAEVAILTRTLVALALTWDNPPGQRQLVISVSLNDFMLLLFGLFVLAFAHVIKEAVRIADENRGFI